MKRILLIVVLLLTVTSFSFAQLAFNGVAPHAGLVIPLEDGLEVGFGFGAKVDMGEISDGIKLVPIVFYHMPGTEFDGVSFSALIIGADVQYGVNDDVYVGGGLAYVNKSAEVEYTNPFTGQKTTADNSEGDIGITLIGGYNLQLGDMPAAVEARFGIVGDYNHFEVGFDVFFGGK